ncbi:hypothetical protein [Streptomyces sp. NPDC051546]|uniref:hypothetical protein n=1 Tax=Streptomyces sp. NPDC051546 TaxID=3365655 RepID=UPI0037A73023
MPLTVILVHSVGALPAQIGWADSHVPPTTLEGLQGNTLEPLVALRLLTVSPMWRLGEAAGTEALRAEAVWTCLFTLVLLAASTMFTGRPGRASYRTLRACVPLVVLAPLAGLAALLVTRIPLFLGEQPRLESSSKFSSPVHGDTPLTEVLQDAYQIAPHSVLLGLSAAGVLLAVKGIRWCASPHVPGVRRAVLLLLALLRGPADTVWRRIGETILVAGTATTALHLLTSPDLAKAARPLLDGYCSGFCDNDIARALLRPRTRLRPYSDAVTIITETFLRPWAYECFALLFALTFFVLRSLPGFRTRPIRARVLFLVCLGSFTVGSVAANTWLVLYSDAAFGTKPLHTFAGLILYSPGLHDALYAGPATALVTTVGVCVLRSLAHGIGWLRRHPPKR